jgi:hypothetical protein
MTDIQPKTPNIAPTGKKYTRVKGNATLEASVIARHMLGQNNQQIAKDLDIHCTTVANVLSSEEMQKTVEYGRSRAVSLIPRSLDVAEYRLGKNDGSMALGILRGTKVLQNEQVVSNTQNNFAFAIAALKLEAQGQASEPLGSSANTLESAPVAQQMASYAAPQISETANVHAVKRGPGRPKGSKNKHPRTTTNSAL